MSANFSIDEKSLRELNANFDDFIRELNIVCKEALKNLGAKIVAAAQTNLRKGRNVATGLLINSGRTAEHADGSILAGFPTMYAYYTEFGRRAGKWPPFQQILQWVRVRHMAADDDEAQDIAYAIQRSIGRKGTKPHPFLRPAFEKNKRLYEQVIRKGAAKVMNKDYTR